MALSVKHVSGSALGLDSARKVYAIYDGNKPYFKIGRSGSPHPQWSSSPAKATAKMRKLRDALAAKAAPAAKKKKPARKPAAATAPRGKKRSSTQKPPSIAACKKLLESKGYSVSPPEEEEEYDIPYEMAKELGLLDDRTAPTEDTWMVMGFEDNPKRSRRKRRRRRR